ncbi:Tfp pilus assembly protein FimV [Chitinivorax tropicus]|uniref:Tfp pilus assembly protein FimV n=1 Tax=Chitinivorax tropicus TaxID=714531 RepID=A0A840MTP6_9PROT|nr:LysM peptidoglycan-binding domain-containing protein [Chitinivorax tropicus]MBB5019663.1 Tfp pilus assembly protein FimV [Chitinivorax tropicus]
MRISIITVAWISLIALSTPQAQATGLGALQVRSFMGERLNAVIPFRNLSLAAEKDLAQCFSVDRSGANDSGYLPVHPNLVVEGNAERGQLLLSTSHALTEPVSVLRIRSHCEQGGESVREYTFFLDPPPAEQSSQEDGQEPIQQVFLPVMQLRPAREEVATQPAPPAASPAQEVKRGEIWKVRKGDSIFRIAKRFEPADINKQRQLEKAIVSANPKLSNPNRIHIGDELLVPDVLPLATPVQLASSTKPAKAPDTLPEAGKSKRVALAQKQDDYQVTLTSTQLEATPAAQVSASGTGKPTDPDDKTAQLLAMRDKVDALEEKISILNKQLTLQSSRHSKLTASLHAVASPAIPTPPAGLLTRPLSSAPALGDDAPPYTALAIGAGMLIVLIFGAGLLNRRTRQANG